MLTLLTALARVSPAARSLTGIRTATEPSVLTRPTRCARQADNPASSALLVPPSECAHASHSSASTKIVVDGRVMGSSAPARNAGGLAASAVAGPAPLRLRQANRIAATTARPI